MAHSKKPKPESAADLTRPQIIAGKLTRRILDGEFPEGSRLPTERELATEYGTTRNVVREALKRLEALRLVTIRRGSGIYAESPQFGAGVELFDVLVHQEDGSLSTGFLRDALEFRANAFRFMVQLAARRRTDDEMAHLRSLVEERAQAKGDTMAIAAATLQIFREIAYATHNQLCQLLFNTVQWISIKLQAMTDIQSHTFDEGQAVFVHLADAIEQRDSTLAELIVIRFLEDVEKRLSLEPAPKGMLYLDDIDRDA
jgi:GntR family transcriptional regulator, transcriptional repressor for pyruvate dehydrogenase complex